MKRKLILQILGCLIGLFVIGGVCGYALAARVSGQSQETAPLPKSESIWLEKHYQETVTRVGLSPEQAEKLRGHYQKLTSEIRTIRENTSHQLGEAFGRHKEAVLPDLTHEQREQYEALVSERRAARAR
jgi:hypothetical protein